MRLMYYTFIIISFFCLLLSIFKTKIITEVDSDSPKYKYSKVILFLITFTLIFVSGFRYGYVDTSSYRLMYLRIGTNFENIFNDTIPVENGFSFFLWILNNFSSDSQLLLVVIALIVNCIVMIQINKYSVSPPFSIYLYYTLIFLGTMNGMRQTLVIIIIFSCFRLIINGRHLRFILIVLLMSTFHTSALIWIPAYFIVRGDLFNNWLKGLIILSLLNLILPIQILNLIAYVLGNSSYSNIIAQTEYGTNIFRVLVNSIPVLLTMIYLRRVDSTNITLKTKVLINCSILNLVFYIMALKMVYFGRVSMYFEVFNILLIPYLLNGIFRGKDKILINAIAIVSYGMFFIYQIISNGRLLDSLRLVFVL